VAPSGEGHEVADLSPAETHPSLQALSSGFQPVFIGRERTQSILYGSVLDAEDRTRFIVRQAVRDPVTRAWSEELHVFTASFVLEHVSSAGSDRFYVLGSSPSGEQVIERWQGVSEAQAGGGGYELKRRELYRGTSLGPVRLLEVDPQERYLLLVHGAPTTVLSQMPLPTGQPVVPLWDSTRIPNLAFVNEAYPRDHLTQGRLWVFTVFGADDPQDPVQHRTLVFDGDDDGVMDGFLTLSEAEWEAQGYTGDVWAGDFGVEW